jgi:hypothetical protein
MMMGWGPFGPIEMGGMFSVVKVREGIGANDYSDPGWYKHPEGTVAHEFKGEIESAPVRKSDIGISRSADHAELRVVKPRHRPSSGHH